MPTTNRGWCAALMQRCSGLRRDKARDDRIVVSFVRPVRFRVDLGMPFALSVRSDSATVQARLQRGNFLALTDVCVETRFVSVPLASLLHLIDGGLHALESARQVISIEGEDCMYAKSDGIQIGKKKMRWDRGRGEVGWLVEVEEEAGSGSSPARNDGEVNQTSHRSLVAWSSLTLTIKLEAQAQAQHEQIKKFPPLPH